MLTNRELRKGLMTGLILLLAGLAAGCVNSPTSAGMDDGNKEPYCVWLNGILHCFDY